MNEKDFHNYFIEFEKLYTLNNFNINKVPIWELSRRQVYLDLKQKIVGSSYNRQTHGAKELFSYFKCFLKALFKKNPFLIANVELLIFSSSRKVKIKEYYEDIYIDKLLSNITIPFSIVEFNYRYKHHNSIHNNNTYFFDIISFPAFILTKSMNYYRNNKISRSVTQINNLINFHFGVKVDNLYDIVSNKYYLFVFSKPLVAKLLNAIKPKKIILYHYYNVFNQTMIYEAKKQNIPVFELQHGIIGELHNAYNFPGKTKLKTFPDYFLSWGNNHIINSSMPIPSNNIIDVGFAYLDHIKLSYNKTQKSDSIIVLSQRRNDLAELTYELASRIKDYTFYFKAHPSEYAYADEQYSFLNTLNNVVLINDDTISLYDLFNETKYSLGINSSALLESLCFNNKVLLANLPGFELLENFVDDNLVFKCPGELITKDFLKSIEKHQYHNAINNIFKSRPIDNFNHIVNNYN